MNRISFLRLAAALCPMAPAALAQGYEVSEIPVHGSFAGAGKIVRGNLFQDGHRDVAVETAGGVRVLYAPGRYVHDMGVTDAHSSLAIMRNGWTRTGSHLFSVVTTGTEPEVARWTFGDPVVAPAFPSWDEVAALDTWGTGQNTFSYAAIHADGVMYYHAFTPVDASSFAAISTVPLGGLAPTMQAFRLAAVHPAANPCLVVIATGSISVLATTEVPPGRAGDAMCAFPGSFADVHTTVFRDGTAVAVASVTDTRNPVPELRIVDLPSASVSSPITLSTPADGIATGRWNADSHEDVCVTAGDVTEIRLWSETNGYAGPPITLVHGEPGFGSGQPWFGDFDGDGDGDVIRAHAGSGKLVLFRNTSIDHLGTRVDLAMVDGDANNLELTLEPPPLATDPVAAMSYDQLQILIWKVDHDGWESGDEPAFDPAGAHHWTLDVSGWTGGQQSLTLPLNSTVGMGDDAFYLELRVRSTAGTGHSYKADRYIATFGPDPLDADWDFDTRGPVIRGSIRIRKIRWKLEPDPAPDPNPNPVPPQPAAPVSLDT